MTNETQQGSKDTSGKQLKAKDDTADSKYVDFTHMWIACLLYINGDR